MAPGLALFAVPALLRSAQHRALAVHGARLKQQLPVLFAGGVGERRRRRENIRALRAQRQRQFGKAQVVADHQANIAKRRFGHNCICARFKESGFLIAADCIADLHIKQMDFVVARFGFFRADAEAGGAHAAVLNDGAVRAERAGQRAGNNPYLMLMRQLLQALLDRFKLGGGFTLLAGSEAGEVFRKDDQACALRFALPDQRFNDSEVRFNVILGIHLGCGKESHNR